VLRRNISIAAVVPSAGEHRHTISVPDPHFNGGKRHTEAGPLHEELGRVIGRHVEPSRFGRCDERFHARSVLDKT
jgi:hypothetical protein